VPLDAQWPDAELDLDAPPDDGTDAADAQLQDGWDPGLDATPDAEPPVMCDAALAGAVEQRLRYAEAQVVASATCESETQYRTCEAAGWSDWSGSFESEQCTVATHRSCGAVVHGGQQLRTRYVAEHASSASGCASQQQSRTCVDGTFGEWSGTYLHPACEVDWQGQCTLDSAIPCAPGTSCVARAPAQELACLGSTGFSCSADEQCVAICLNGTCAARVQPGDWCEEASDCDACSDGSSVDCVTGTCRCGDGGQCSANEQCQNTCVAAMCAPANARCDDDEDCREERKCYRKAGANRCLLADGKTCDTNAACQHVCRASECDALGKPDDVCDENADCAPALVCRSEMCAPAGSKNQPCDENADCAQGLACSTSSADPVCLKAAGQPCTPLSLECVSGICPLLTGVCP
jgi:hypothetical protein